MAITTLLFISGACVVSFIQLCADRLAAQQSLLLPRSFCFNCHHKLSYYDLIPIISYLYLHGRCRYCHQRLKLTMPIFEIIGGLVTIWLVNNLAVSMWPFMILLCGELIFVTLTDINEYFIYTFPTIAITLALLIIHPTDITVHWRSCLAITTPLLLYSRASHGLGLGDILLIAQISLFCSWELTLLGILIACLICMGFFYWQQLLFKRHFLRMPFVPFLTSGWLISYLWQFYFL
ncbi:MAG: prepilin peptidase [Candidatus Paralactobacillus gallistercoris]|uniref:Prepilin peptidase n=1 Tax=Candidatus Paralactobacillus gallistercoris TaxID=2838724 RepID=A0A948X0G5_9LACO|nr:prepilin peptidase [Candidatus Paralactobacillus gallistercoris]